MTDKPTLSLDSMEWRGLLSQNLVRANEYVQQNAQIDAAGVKAMHDYLDRMKALVTAWQRSAPQAAPDVPQTQQATPATNGAAAPKKRRGRRTNAERAAMAAQGMQ